MIQISTKPLEPRRYQNHSLPRFAGRPGFIHGRDRYLYNRIWHSYLADGCSPDLGDGTLARPCPRD